MYSRQWVLCRADRFAKRVLGELDELAGTGDVFRGLFVRPRRFGIVVAEEAAVLRLNQVAVQFGRDTPGFGEVLAEAGDYRRVA